MSIKQDLYAFGQFESDFIEQFGEKERATQDLFDTYLIKCIEGDETSYYYENKHGEHARFNFYIEKKENEDGVGMCYYMEYGGIEV